MGTQDHFHLVRAWNKLLKPEEVDRVAVPLGECDVVIPRTIADENAVSRRGHRGVDLTHGCTVH